MGDYEYEDYSYTTENNQNEGNKENRNERKDSEQITISTKQLKKAYCSISVQNVFIFLVLVANTILVSYISIGKLSIKQELPSKL